MTCAQTRRNCQTRSNRAVMQNLQKVLTRRGGGDPSVSIRDFSPAPPALWAQGGWVSTILMVAPKVYAPWGHKAQAALVGG